MDETRANEKRRECEQKDLYFVLTGRPKYIRVRRVFSQKYKIQQNSAMKIDFRVFSILTGTCLRRAIGLSERTFDGKQLFPTAENNKDADAQAGASLGAFELAPLGTGHFARPDSMDYPSRLRNPIANTLQMPFAVDNFP